MHPIGYLPPPRPPPSSPVWSPPPRSSFARFKASCRNNLALRLLHARRRGRLGGSLLCCLAAPDEPVLLRRLIGPRVAASGDPVACAGELESPGRRRKRHRGSAAPIGEMRSVVRLSKRLVKVGCSGGGGGHWESTATNHAREHGEGEGRDGGEEGSTDSRGDG
jgi:hypothetical protein